VRAPGAVVVFAHLRYDGVRQRPQHLMSRLARRADVLYVEEPLAGAADRDERFAADGLTVLRPHRRAPSEAIDAATLGSVRDWLRGRAACAWFYTPMMSGALDAIAFACVAFDAMDDLSSFRFAPPALLAREAALLARADVVFAGGASLYERLRERIGVPDKLLPFASGIEWAHFAAAAAPGAAIDPLVRALAGPVFGYYGVIDERIDLSLFAELAAGGGDVVAAGPFAKIDPRELPGGTRIHYTGLVPYARLPALLAGFDVALMPFAASDATRHLSPTKTPEYLAGGRPVVSTEIADVRRFYGEVVDVVPRERFVEHAYARAAAPVPGRAARGAALARRADWDAIADGMWAALTR